MLLIKKVLMYKTLNPKSQNYLLYLSDYLNWSSVGNTVCSFATNVVSQAMPHFPKIGPDNDNGESSEPPPPVPKSLRAAQPPTPQDQVTS